MPVGDKYFLNLSGLHVKEEWRARRILEIFPCQMFPPRP